MITGYATSRAGPLEVGGGSVLPRTVADRLARSGGKAAVRFGAEAVLRLVGEADQVATRCEEGVGVVFVIDDLDELQLAAARARQGVDVVHPTEQRRPVDVPSRAV